MVIAWSVEKKLDSKNLKDAKTNKGKLMILSKCVAFDDKKSRFIKEQEVSGLLRSFSQIPLSQIPLVCPILF